MTDFLDHPESWDASSFSLTILTKIVHNNRELAQKKLVSYLAQLCESIILSLLESRGKWYPHYITPEEVAEISVKIHTMTLML